MSQIDASNGGPDRERADVMVDHRWLQRGQRRIHQTSLAGGRTGIGNEFVLHQLEA